MKKLILTVVVFLGVQANAAEVLNMPTTYPLAVQCWANSKLNPNPSGAFGVAVTFGAFRKQYLTSGILISTSFAGDVYTVHSAFELRNYMQQCRQRFTQTKTMLCASNNGKTYGGPSTYVLVSPYPSGSAIYYKDHISGTCTSNY